MREQTKEGDKREGDNNVEGKEERRWQGEIYDTGEQRRRRREKAKGRLNENERIRGAISRHLRSD